MNPSMDNWPLVKPVAVYTLPTRLPATFPEAASRTEELTATLVKIIAVEFTLNGPAVFSANN